MKEFTSLLKTQLNVNFGFSAIRYKYFKQRRELWQPILFLLAFLSLIPLYVSYIKMLNTILASLKSINQEGTVLLLGVLWSQIILFVFGISHIFAKFYYSDDLQILIPLPLKPSKVLTSRFIVVMINEYLVVLPIMLPIIIAYGLQNSVTIIYWLFSILILILLPIIPLALSSIMVIIFMRYTNLRGKRDLIRVIGGVLMVALILLIQFIGQKSSTNLPQGGELEYLSRLISEKNSLINRVGASFPPSIWATRALIDFNRARGLVNLLIFLLLSIVIFFGMVYVSERIFYKGLIGGQELAPKKKKLTDKELKVRLARTSHPTIAIFLKEMKILIRTPIYLMNSIGAVIIIPFAMAIPILASKDEIGKLISEFNKTSNGAGVNLLLIAFIMFMAANNGIGSTTFSREGRQFWISRIVPLKVEYQLMGKILSSLFVQLIGLIIVLAIALFILPLKIFDMAIISLLGLLGSIPLTELAMFVDITRPLLDWDNPQRAMKQNMNVLFSFIIGILYILANFILVMAMLKIGVDGLSIYLFLGTIYIIGSVALFGLLSKYTARRFKDIEA